MQEGPRPLGPQAEPRACAGTGRAAGGRGTKQGRPGLHSELEARCGEEREVWTLLWVDIALRASVSPAPKDALKSSPCTLWRGT